VARISLCIIARDEERMLPGCLASVQGAVDEIVLVDTGSRDATRRLAEEAGARVLEQPWRDDFSEPRNAALARATGDWILQLDADERLAPNAAAALREAADRGGFDVGLLRLHNAARVDAASTEVLAGRARLGQAILLPRLIRRGDGIRYSGIIHESVEESFGEPGARLAAVPVDVVHLGAAPDLRAAAGKRERNLRLLHRRCLLEPDSTTPFGYLAMELLEAGQLADAAAAAEEGWAKVGAQPHHRSIHLLAVARGLAALRAGAVERLIETAEQALVRERGGPDLQFLLGCGLETRALGLGQADPARARLLERAAVAYQRAGGAGASGAGQVIVEGSGSWASATRLGTVRLLQERLDEARAAFDDAWKVFPGHLEARLGQLEVRLAQGDFQHVLAQVEPLLGPAPDGWLLAAAAARGLGAVDHARVFFAAARERARGGYLSPHRRQRQRELDAALG
jgi:tetratricopeptide (TPR) repeat protein